MLRLLEETLKQKDFKTICSNFLSLTVLQALNVILPFLTIPYLIHTIGVENYGLLSFIFAFTFFFQIVVEYGFNTVTTREISVHKDNANKLSEIYSEVIFTKTSLLVISFLFFSVIIFVIPQLRVYWLLYLLQFGCVLGQAMFPVFIFQGLQKMKFITYLNVVFKSTFTICIFLFVKDINHMWLVPFFNALGFIFSGITALFIVKFHFEISLKAVRFLQIKKQLKSGLYIFLSEFQVNLIAYGNTLILGFLLGNTAVGIYSTAEKIIRAMGNFQAPIINALFPYVSNSMQVNRAETFKMLSKVKIVAVVLLGVFTLLGYIFAYEIFQIIFNKDLKESIVVFRILIFFPLLSFLDQYYGKLILLTNGMESQFFKVFFITSILSLILSVGLTYFFSYRGTAVANLIIQFLVFLGMYFYARTQVTRTHAN